MRSHKAVGAGVILTAVLVMTGCSATSQETAPETLETVEPTAPAETPTEEPVATEAPTVPEGPAVGTVVAERPEDLPDGLGWFQLDDGTYLVVDSYAPLPQVVVDQTAAVVADPVSSTDDWSAIRQSASDAQGRIQRGTGKQAVVIYSIIALATENMDGPRATYYNLSGAAKLPQASDKATAVAAAEAYVASQSDPSRWVIIDSTL